MYVGEAAYIIPLVARYITNQPATHVYHRQFNLRDFKIISY